MDKKIFKIKNSKGDFVNIEKLMGMKKVKITIDKKYFKVDQYISGLEIKRLAGITEEMDKLANESIGYRGGWKAFKHGMGTDDDIQIDDNELIDTLTHYPKRYFTACLNSTN